MKIFSYLIVSFVILLLIQVQDSQSISAYETDFSTQTNTLIVNYVDNFAPSYEVDVPKDEKHILIQSYSWVRDNTSRYNLVSYSIDGGDFIQIQRKFRGDFSVDIPMDTSHVITFKALIQYPIEIDGISTFSFMPNSPTGDVWFDSGTDVLIQVPYTIILEEKKSRSQIIGWSINDSEFIPINRNDSGFFETESIHISDGQKAKFFSVRQYWIDVISDIGNIEGSGWYDEGSMATILAKPLENLFSVDVIDRWEGSGLNSVDNPAPILVNSPLVITAKWKTDYSKAIVLGGAIAGLVTSLMIILRKRKNQVLKERPIFEPAPSAVDYENTLDEFSTAKYIEKLDYFLGTGLINEPRLKKIKEKLAVFDSL